MCHCNQNCLRLNHSLVIWTSIQNLFAVVQSENKLSHFPSEYASSHTPSNCQVLPTDLKIAAKIICDASMVGYRLVNLDFNSRFAAPQCQNSKLETLSSQRDVCSATQRATAANGPLAVASWWTSKLDNN